jgi:hypothetical protein
MPEKKVDKTRNERQARRRAREKQWLTDHGFSSWELLHTKLLGNKLGIVNLVDEDVIISKGD